MMGTGHAESTTENNQITVPAFVVGSVSIIPGFGITRGVRKIEVAETNFELRTTFGRNISVIYI
jgi:hypothetical protein